MAGASLQGQFGERHILIFTDRTRGVFAVDAANGELVWHAIVSDEPVPVYSGTPLVIGDTVFVPISSMEVGIAMNPFYGCCTTSGGMAALDISTGEQRWYLPTIEAEAEVTGSHFLFVKEYGPSGATVWAAPSFDAARNRLAALWGAAPVSARSREGLAELMAQIERVVWREERAGIKPEFRRDAERWEQSADDDSS